MESEQSKTQEKSTVPQQTSDWCICIICKKCIGISDIAHLESKVHQQRVAYLNTISLSLPKYIISIPRPLYSETQMEYPAEYMPNPEEVTALYEKYQSVQIKCHGAAMHARNDHTSTQVIRNADIEYEKNAKSLESLKSLSSTYKSLSHYRTYSPFTEGNLHTPLGNLHTPLNTTTLQHERIATSVINNNNNDTILDQHHQVIIAGYKEAEAELLDEALMKRILEESAEEHSKLQISKEVESEQEKIRRHYEESLLHNHSSHIANSDDEIYADSNSFDSESSGKDDILK